jgi:hypothetical protein
MRKPKRLRYGDRVTIFQLPKQVLLAIAIRTVMNLGAW